MQRPDNILDILTNIYDITNKIHKLVVAANADNKNIADELQEQFEIKGKLIELLVLAKESDKGLRFFKDNKELLSKEYKIIADIEIVTMKLLENKLEEMAHKLKGLQRSKGLLIYQKG